MFNYDFYDIHFVITMLRAKPGNEYNFEIVNTVLDVLITPQADNTIDDNIIRKRLRKIENIDKDDFRWVYADNIYTYGLKVIKDDAYYSFLANGFKMMLEYVEMGNIQRLEDLADALHNVPVFFADGCKNFKKTVKIQFAHYDKTYKTNLLKELLK
ncbi:MAG: hypothetical protein IJD95_01920 [Clostridia bacterium]|nr:hypothetical protein [Clostridia bacterium]